MKLLDALETATYPLWINDSEDEINTDRYEEYTACAFEQFPNLHRQGKSITVDGAGELVIEI